MRKGILDIIAEETGGERQYSTQYAISYKGSHYAHRQQIKPTEDIVENAEEELKMTIKDLRKMYPSSDFYFFKDGFELRKAPFYHAEVASYEEINSFTVFIHMK